MRALTLLLLALSGCSVLFDPSKAPAKQCPTSPAACPALPNATAHCDGTVCAYSCVDHFVDGNGDLADGGADGCELDCTSTQTPANPASLTAVVGAAAGQVDWSFPAVSGVAKYTLCVAPPGGAQVCVNVETASCDTTTCVQTTTGHTDNVRVTGRLVAVDSCGRQGDVSTAPEVSTTPLDTNDPSKWTHDPSCANSSFDVVGGQLSLEQQADTCAASLVAGDDQWADFTVDGDLKYGLNSAKASGGLGVHVNGSGFRMGALLAAESTDNDVFTALTRRLQSTSADQTVASSIHGGSATGMTHLRLISHQGVISLLEGPTVNALNEVIRFPDPLQKPGKLGIAAFGTGRVEVTNFRVSTASDLPPRGPTSLVLDFGDGGPGPAARPTGASLSYAPCPPLPASPGCDGGCLPSASSGCVHVVHGNFLFDGTSLAFDLPTGIDVSAPWSLSMKLALTPDAGSSFPQALKSQQGPVLEAASFSGWGAPVSGLGVNDGQTLDAGEWHDARWSFDPDGGRFALTLDDTPVALPSNAFPPNGWSPHLGAFSLFSGNNNDAWATDVRVSQP